MSVKNRVRIIFLSRIIKNLVWAAPFLVKFSPMRHSMIRIGGRIARFTQKRKNFDFLQQPGVIADRSDFRRAILHSLDRTLSYISPAALQGLLNSLLSNYVSEDVDRKAIDRFYAQNGTYPPNFLTISPGKACNLQCVGCYANSEEAGKKLEWATFDRIIAEAKAMWGIRFFVISGGEPLAYRSEGKTILDIAEKHSDCIFMMYTNGTLITDEMAQRLATLQVHAIIQKRSSQISSLISSLKSKVFCMDGFSNICRSVVHTR
jgi:sulfatase maturation enzyme AslB (radical SAM superfamily)